MVFFDFLEFLPKFFFHKTPKKKSFQFFFQKNFIHEIELDYEGLKYTKNKEGLESFREPGSAPGEYK